MSQETEWGGRFYKVRGQNWKTLFFFSRSLKRTDLTKGIEYFSYYYYYYYERDLATCVTGFHSHKIQKWLCFIYSTPHIFAASREMSFDFGGEPPLCKKKIHSTCGRISFEIPSSQS